MVLYRFLFACLGMLPVALMNRVRLTRSEIRLLLISAAFGIPIQFLIQFHGLARTTVSHASLMVGSMPVLLGVAAAIFAGERLDRIGWLALVGIHRRRGSHRPRRPPRTCRPGRTHPRGRSHGRRLALHRSRLDFAQQETDAIPQPSGGYGLHHSHRNRDAGGMDSRPDAAQSMALEQGAAAALRSRQPHRLGRSRHQRTCVHRNHDPPMELGHPSCPRIARRRLSQHRARARFLARRQAPRRTSRAACMGLAEA